MSIAHSRGVSRASKSRRAALLDDAEYRIERPKTRGATLLENSTENEEYAQLRHYLAGRAGRERINNAARLIQDTFRAYQTHKHFEVFIVKYRRLRYQAHCTFFYTLALNANSPCVDRKRFFNSIQTKMGNYCTPKHPTQRTTFSAFCVTGLYTIPANMDQARIVSFVKLCMKGSMRRILDEWRLIARRQRLLKTKIAPENFSVRSQMLFGSYFVCFAMWLQLTREKHHHKNPCLVPHWQKYLEIRTKIQAETQMAIRHHETSLKKKVIQHLYHRLLIKRNQKIAIEEGKNFRLQRLQKFALAAWLKTITQQKSHLSGSKYYFRKWLLAVHSERHREYMINVFTQRHEFFTKRAVMEALCRNRRISHIFTTESYIKVMAKPSLALAFVACLQHDDVHEAFYKAVYAWIRYHRGRIKFRNFIYYSQTLNYFRIKKWALMRLRGNRKKVEFVCPYPTHQFKEQTLSLREPDDPPELGILVPQKMDFKYIVFNSRSNYQNSKQFFSSWKTTKPDALLFQRLVYLSIYQNQRRNAPSLTTVIDNLQHHGITSKEQLNYAVRAIMRNNQRSLQNRRRCIHRDNILYLAYVSHGRSVLLSDVTPRFTSLDTFEVFKSAALQTVELSSKFEQLERIDSAPRRTDTTLVNSLDNNLTVIRPFKREIAEVHALIHSDMAKFENGNETITRFDHLLSGSDHTNFRNRGIKTFSRVEGYIVPRAQTLNRPHTGINRRLTQAFPWQQRKPTIIGNEAVYTDIESLGVTEEGTTNTEEVVDIPPPIKIEKEEPILITAEARNRSTTFGDLKSFQNLLTGDNKQLSDSEESGEEEEEEEFLDPKKKTSPTEKQKKEPEEYIDDNMVNDDISTGFKDILLDPFKTSVQTPNPNAEEKYRQFLEILFGKASRDNSNGNVSILRRKLMNELRTRKASLSAQGIVTTNLIRPVTGVVERYRIDKKKPKADVSQQNATAPVQRNQEVNNEGTSYEEVYNSRRFHHLYRTKILNKDENDEDEEEEEEYNGNEGLFEQIPIENRRYEDYHQEPEDNEEVDDADIDAAEASPHSQSTNTRLSDGNILVDALDDAAIVAMNKVVFHIIEKLVKEENGEGVLVDTDQDALPSLDIDGIDDQQKTPNHIWRPSTTYNPKRHRLTRMGTKKKSEVFYKPIETTATASHLHQMMELQNLGGIVFDRGTTLEIASKLPPGPKIQPLVYRYEEPIRSLNGFQDPDQMVSFGSRKAGSKTRIGRPQLSKQGRPRQQSSLSFLPISQSSRPPIKDAEVKNLNIVFEAFGEMLFSHVSRLSEYNGFLRKAHMIVRSGGHHQPAKKVDFFAQFQKIYIEEATQKNTKDTMNTILNLLFESRDKSHLFVEALERVKNRHTQPTPKGSVINPMVMAAYEKPPWDYVDYTDIAILYRGGCDTPDNLDAILARIGEARTKAQKPKPRPKTEEVPQGDWDSVLAEYSLEEMLMITPMVIPERVVDKVLDIRQRTRMARRKKAEPPERIIGEVDKRTIVVNF